MPRRRKLSKSRHLQGLKIILSLSPKGDRVAFSWRDLNQSALHLYIKPLGEGEPLQLTSSLESDVLPAWSPDGERIAFCRRPTWYSGFDKQFRTPASIYIISARGGAERLVTEGWAGVSWSADGKPLAIARFPSGGEDSGGIDLFSIVTGERRRLTYFTRGHSSRLLTGRPVGRVHPRSCQAGIRPAVQGRSSSLRIRRSSKAAHF